ncbi:hypothetical protein J1N35_025980 [Gossypium stocksii]|uniref:Fatty acid hydroxylase domain-containing protein n=1 Tax=Gossypium stocksii TaxID=47602 RepID=A0A9D3ZXP4_9ROSI|nr:hypothetical protein J1N35_025980 [Gossypium stocksii]
MGDMTVYGGPWSTRVTHIPMWLTIPSKLSKKEEMLLYDSLEGAELALKKNLTVAKRLWFSCSAHKSNYVFYTHDCLFLFLVFSLALLPWTLVELYWFDAIDRFKLQPRVKRSFPKIPTFFGPAMVPCHMIILCLWSSLRQVEAIETRRGYNFPWSPTKLIPFYGGPEYHDFHHFVGRQCQSNFASIFIYCDYLYGANKRIEGSLNTQRIVDNPDSHRRQETRDDICWSAGLDGHYKVLSGVIDRTSLKLL